MFKENISQRGENELMNKLSNYDDISEEKK